MGRISGILRDSFVGFPCNYYAHFLAKTVKIEDFLHGSRVLSDGAPEEIRTPDPQIRSFILRVLISVHLCSSKFITVANQ
jgi:hypothetical protein